MGEPVASTISAKVSFNAFQVGCIACDLFRFDSGLARQRQLVFVFAVHDDARKGRAQHSCN